VEDGLNYVDIRWQGTLTSGLANTVLATPDSQTQIVASNGQTWSGSWFVKVVGGSLANISALSISITERTSAGAFVTFGLVGITPSGAPLAQQRYSYVKTLDGGATTARVTTDIRATASSGAAIDITLRIGMPQLEQGSGATSVIPTAGTSVVRAADVASITGTNFSSWYRQDEGMFYVDGFRETAVPDLVYPVLIDGRVYPTEVMQDPTDVMQIGYLTEDLASQYILANAVVQSELYTTGLTGARRRRAVSAYQANNFAVSINGSIPLVDTLGAPSTNIASISIGSAGLGMGQYLNGPIARLDFYPRRGSNAIVQELSR
jgi:hypothetical protein